MKPQFMLIFMDIVSLYRSNHQPKLVFIFAQLKLFQYETLLTNFL